MKGTHPILQLIILFMLTLTLSTSVYADTKDVTLTLYNNATENAAFHLITSNQNIVKMLDPYNRAIVSYPSGTEVSISCTVRGSTYWAQTKMDEAKHISTSDIFPF